MSTTPSPLRTSAAWALGVLALATACGIAWHRHARVERAPEALPVAERHALYERTRETLRVTCSPAAGSELEPFCRAQAAWLARFPECDEPCNELVRRFRPTPTR